MMLVIALALLGAVGLASVVIPPLIHCLSHRPQNLKKRYGAEWALVTGGSSGIGRSLCHKLAAQGLSVVVVAVPDPLLEEVGRELRAAYPAVSVRVVGADLSRPGYLERVAAATEDITVQVRAVPACRTRAGPRLGDSSDRGAAVIGRRAAARR